jgi:hypothetical protein
MAWFSYDSGNPTAPGSYSPVDGDPDCTTGSQLCAINASGSTQPTITAPLISEMLVAVVTQTPSANVRLKPEQ